MSEIKIHKKAKELVEEYKVDISKVVGSGENGRIIKKDVMKYLIENEIIKESDLESEKPVRNFMYVEAIGCLPKKWLLNLGDAEPVALTRVNDDGNEENIKHADGTDVLYYPEALVDIGAVESTVKRMMPKGTQYVIMIHDLEEGEGMKNEPHIHIHLHIPGTSTPSAIRSNLGLYDESKEKFIQKVRPKNKGAKSEIYSKRTMFTYLVHTTDGAIAEGKANYEHYVDDVYKMRSNFDYKSYLKYVNAEVDSKKIDVDMLITEILDGKVKKIDLVNDPDDMALTRTYLDNKKKIDDALKIANDTYLKRARAGEVLPQLMYVVGKSGSGKTTFAQDYAKKTYKHYYVTGSQNDPLQDYAGEECVIFDDARPSDFGASDWLKMLDPTTRTSTASRFVNKVITAKCIIFTSVVPFESFFAFVKNKGGVEEPLNQFIRRFDTVIEVDSDLKRVYRDKLYGYRTVDDNGIDEIRKGYRSDTMESMSVAERNDLISKSAYVKWAEDKLKEKGIDKNIDDYYVCRLYSVEKMTDEEEPVRVNLEGSQNFDRQVLKITYTLKEFDNLIIQKLPRRDTTKVAKGIFEVFK